MLFGGTNPDDRAARWVTTSYDYDAPIREWGGVGDRYQIVRAIGLMLQKHGVSLTRSEAVTNSVTTSQKDVTVVESAGRWMAAVIFSFRTSQHEEPRQGTATIKESTGDSSGIVINYQLEPCGWKIFYLPPGVNDAGQGEWFPEAAPSVERPAPSDLPSGITITSAKMQADPGPKRWTKLKPDETLAQAGVYDSHFIFYSGKVSCATATNFEVKYPDGDSVLAAINGKSAESVSHSGSCSIFAMPAGRNAIELFYENHGFDNGGKAMVQQGGIIEAGTTRDAFAEGTAVSGWRMQVVNGTTHRPEVESNFDDGHWSNVTVDNEDANQLSPNQDAVFRAAMNLTPAELNGAKMILSFKRIDDLGWVYVNGKQVGVTTDWSQSYSFDVTKELHPGRNIIAVVVQNIGGGGGIGKPELNAALEKPAGQAVALRLFGRPTGDEKEWWAADFNDKDWTSVPMDETTRRDNPMLTWYRMDFSLPSQQTGVWVPWRLHLMAHGNGFLCLNGHPLRPIRDVGATTR